MIGDYKENVQRGQIMTEDVPVPQVNIASELTDLSILVARAHEIFTDLEERTRFIRQPTPQCAEKEPNQIHSGSELRSILAEQNQRLRSLTHRMSTMIDEIDL